jgi:hypothetical protein
MLRQFAEAELQNDDKGYDRTLNGHKDFYASLVEEATELLTLSDQVRMAELIEADLDNVRFAWRRSLKTGDGAAGIKILRGLYFLYEWRGWFPSAVGLFGEALEHLDAGDPDESCLRLRAMSLAVQSWFRSLIGQAEKGSAGASEAMAGLPESTPLIDHWITRQILALGYGYTGAVEALIHVTDEGIELTASMADGFYAAGMKNWRSFAAVLGEDPSVATKLLSEAAEVFGERGDHYFMTWTLWLQALLAISGGRPVDAIDLFGRQVARAEELGYLRGRVVGLEGLGDANVAAGRPLDARTAYLKSLTTADQMGMVADMLGLMTKIGGVLASEGRLSEAVEMLSTVCIEPISNQMTFNYTSPIRETALATLKEVETEMDESAYREATRRGSAREWEVVAKELMDTAIGL